MSFASFLNIFDIFTPRGAQGLTQRSEVILPEAFYPIGNDVSYRIKKHPAQIILRQRCFSFLV